MATRRSSISHHATVTPERATRLYGLVTLLGARPQTRQYLTRRLAVGVRDFYRDLEILRKAGVAIGHEHGEYTLDTELDKAHKLIPFPNPGLTLGEAEQLARGRSAVHRKLKEQVAAMQSTRNGGKGKKKRS
jgi:predicted DNA-binding transcriptional regulator YafY